MSYNPSLEDHQDLIKQVVDSEEKIIKEEKHLKRVTTQMFLKVTPEERDKRRLKEMRAGLDDDDDDENNEETHKPSKESTQPDHNTTNQTVEDSIEEPYKTINPPVENKKKSKQARRKELQQKQLQKKQKEKKAAKKQTADLIR